MLEGPFISNDMISALPAARKGPLDRRRARVAIPIRGVHIESEFVDLRPRYAIGK